MSVETIIYICGQCNKPLESDSLQNHVCWPNVSVEPVFNGEDEEADNEEGVGINTDEEQISVVTLVDDGLKKKHSIKNRRGEWTEDDVHRLIAVYIKNYKLLPRKDPLHKHYFWDRVMKDLTPYGNFSRFLVQTKINKLKNATKLLIRLDPNTKWPFYQEMCELLNMESDETLPLSPEYDSENDSSDDNNPEGLRRWTIKETRHLLDVYKKHMPRMVVNGNRRKTAWNDIIADLDYDLPKRYSMIQIRSRIRNVLNTYRAIIAHKRKRQMTHWPLFKDVAELMKTEQLLFADSQVFPVLNEEFMYDEDTDHDERNFRWNVEETQELITAYLNRLADLSTAVTDEEIAIIWDKITDQVNAVRRRKVCPANARNKINTLRSLYGNNNEKNLGPVYEHVRTMFETERLYYNSSHKRLPRRKRKHPMGEAPKREDKQQKTENLPSWFIQYSEDSQRRHSEKMAIHLSMIQVLEKVLAKE